MEYLALNRQPVRFSPSRTYRKPFLTRIVRSVPPLEQGLILPKREAVALAKSGMGLVDVAKAVTSAAKPSRLVSEMIPAWVAASAR
ncbi:MAG: hypothetical protein EOP17_21470 [Rhizobiaceae bacterium]|nr:MAG: hypothetical protein EOP17_21470 [Rhizobiaceae bacterium]